MERGNKGPAPNHQACYEIETMTILTLGDGPSLMVHGEDKSLICEIALGLDIKKSADYMRGINLSYVKLH